MDNREYKKFPVAIGDIIIDYRYKNALSEKELANRLGVHRSTIRSWEFGETYPSARNLSKLAEEMGISAWELIRGMWLNG